jgi:nucleotide-binding universal stress UspA family protein
MIEKFSHPRVVVGVDDSLTGLAALRVAVAEARRRGLPLHAVRAATHGVVCYEQGVIAQAFHQALGGVPDDIEVHQDCLSLCIRDAIRMSATDPRDLIVLGNSGKGLWHAIWSGSSSRALLRRARCQVLAVPAPEMTRGARRARRRLRSPRRDVWAQFEQETPQLRGRPYQGI